MDTTTHTAPDGRERIAWPGIPEAYWPYLDKPWRVTYGFGCFDDFATEASARQAYDRLRARQPDLNPSEPFNAVELEVD